MTDFEPEEDLPPVAHVTIVYQGPVAPHWEMKVRYGDQKMLDDFWTRVNARLLLLPKHDPQFRRNRERVNRDAERERIVCDWDLGEDDAETTTTEPAQPVTEAAPAEDASAGDETPEATGDGATEAAGTGGGEAAEAAPADAVADDADADAVADDDGAADAGAVANDAGADADGAADSGEGDDGGDAGSDDSEAEASEMAAGQA